MSASCRRQIRWRRPVALWQAAIAGPLVALGMAGAIPCASAGTWQPGQVEPAADGVSTPDVHAVDDLPLELLPVTTPSSVMAIIYSGDGGWRDLDKEIGENLQAFGMPVVGLDTLQYFWNHKSPEEAAASLAAVIDHFTSAWSTPNVLLIGYSFGADVLPFAVNRLPDAERRRIRQITLLALGIKADFEIHVSAWGSGTGRMRSAQPIAPELQPARSEPAAVRLRRRGQAETACALLAGSEVIETPGGHHFDGDYGAITRGSSTASPAAGRCRPRAEVPLRRDLKTATCGGGRPCAGHVLRDPCCHLSHGRYAGTPAGSDSRWLRPKVRSRDCFAVIAADRLPGAS